MEETRNCGACGGQGGWWVTRDGKTPGRDYDRWVACTVCGGSGKVRR